MIRATFKMGACAVLVPLLGAGCLSGDPRGRGMGADFFAKDFKCTSSGLFPHEKLAPGHRVYKHVRGLFAADSRRRKKARFVLTGDSTSMLFTPERLKKYLPGVDIANRGIAGDTTFMLYERLADVIVLKPRVVVVAIGGNDILGGRCPTVILEQTRRIVASLQKRLRRVRVILVSVPPVWTHRANAITPFYNRQLEYLAADLGPRVSFLDLWPTMADRNRPQLKRVYWSYTKPGKVDQVHFNEQGYRAWADLLKARLK